MISFIKFLMQMFDFETWSSKKLIIALIVLLAIFPMSIFYISYYFKKQKIEIMVDKKIPNKLIR